MTIDLAAYDDFLRAKVVEAPRHGAQVPPGAVHPILNRHQPDIVRWAVEGGRRAIFAAFGLGKTFMQVEVVRLSLEQTGGMGLIVCPLGVRAEFIEAGVTLGVPIRFIRSLAETDGTGIYLTNYETVRDGRLDPAAFQCASLDEASVLRSYGSKTFQTFLTLFAAVPRRFVATATPSPNRYKELIHYAGYLGVMDTGQALTRFFHRDSQKANSLTLYPHKELEFWHWVASWAVFVQKPSDLGYDDTGYDLPPLSVHWHEVKVDLLTDATERDGQGVLIRDDAMGLRQAAAEKRATLAARVAKTVDIVAQHPTDHWLIWHDLEDERRALEQAFPRAKSVYGSQDLERREEVMADFAHGRLAMLLTKPVLAGSGTNLQRHCHRMVFVGVGFKFNDFIQAVHRLHRYLQVHPVEVHVIYAETEREVLRVLQDKWAKDKELRATMSDLIRANGLAGNVADILARSMGCERVEARGTNWTAVHNDCVREVASLAENSVGLVVTSIPFANHYEYTPSVNDFGHTDDNDHFWQQMDWLTPALYRALMPGRLYCCHVKDRINFGNVTGEGVPTVSPFHAEAIFHGRKHGFQYMGLVTVVTDVVRENNQTYRLGWSEQCKDGTKMGVGSPEYVVLFRKPQTDRSRGYADCPVTKEKTAYTRARWQVDAHAFWRSSGDRPIEPEHLLQLGPDKLAKLFREWTRKELYDHEHHIRVGEALEVKGALPATFMAIAPGSHDPEVWCDINRMLTLNGAQSAAGRELHICPLQFDIVDRLIRRYSNPGDLVLDPFGGLMTVPMRALKLGRRGYGCELNPRYWADGCAYLAATERELAVPSLFDLLDQEAAA